jgi:hypothetical protein
MDHLKIITIIIIITNVDIKIAMKLHKDREG